MTKEQWLEEAETKLRDLRAAILAVADWYDATIDTAPVKEWGLMVPERHYSRRLQTYARDIGEVANGLREQRANSEG
jgi:hypothetical protein